MSFNWTQLIPGVGHEYSHVATAGLVGGVLVVTSFAARSALGTGPEAVIPSGRFSIRALCETCVEFIANLADMVIGKDGRKYVPLFAAIFTWTLVNNLVGVIPGMTPPTENLNTSLAMGLCMFVLYIVEGLRANGTNFLKHLLGPIWWLAPLFLIIELISNVVRPLSLGLRLANVLHGDHTVLGVFLNLIPIGVPIPFYLLGMFVCLIQAFVFTLLSMVYVALATAHEEHH